MSICEIIASATDFGFAPTFPEKILRPKMRCGLNAAHSENIINVSAVARSSAAVPFCL
ncbi:hypothetical protein D3C86_1831210 [compost metagenome]